MMEHLWDGHSLGYRRLFCYRRSHQVSLQEAVELATIARMTYCPTVIFCRGRRCDASDPFALFLLKITSGDSLVIEVGGRMTPEVLRELERVIERMGTAPDRGASNDRGGCTDSGRASSGKDDRIGGGNS